VEFLVQLQITTIIEASWTMGTNKEWVVTLTMSFQAIMVSE
jgi:hypothetical protein